MELILKRKIEEMKKLLNEVVKENDEHRNMYFFDIGKKDYVLHYIEILEKLLNNLDRTDILLEDLIKIQKINDSLDKIEKVMEDLE